MSAELAMAENLHDEIDILIDAKRLSLAEQKLRDSLKVDPNSIELRACLVRLKVAQDRYAEALKVAENVLASQPKHPIRTLLPLILSECGRSKDAENLLVELIQEFPEVSYYYSMLAHVLWYELGAPLERVEPHLREALRLDPSSIHAKCIEFSLASFLGNFELMSKVIADVQRIDPAGEATALLLSEYIAYEKPKDFATIQKLLALFPTEKSLIQYAIRAKVDSHFLFIPERWVVSVIRTLFGKIVKALQSNIFRGFVLLILAAIVAGAICGLLMSAAVYFGWPLMLALGAVSIGSPLFRLYLVLKYSKQGLCKS